MGYPVVLTCDRTMASEYHGLMFPGFSACIPYGTIPDWIYYPVFSPSAPADSEGRLKFANCGMRRIDLTPLHDDLLAACWEHNAKWFHVLWTYYVHDQNFLLRHSVDFFLKHGIRYFQSKMKRDALKRHRKAAAAIDPS